MKIGIVLVPGIYGSSDFGGDHNAPGTTMYEGPGDGRPRRCLKCERCGHSYVCAYWEWPDNEQAKDVELRECKNCDSSFEGHDGQLLCYPCHLTLSHRERTALYMQYTPTAELPSASPWSPVAAAVGLLIVFWIILCLLVNYLPK